MSGPIAVGIDLGTTHTITAIVNESGHTDVLRDREGDCLLPSVVLFDTEGRSLDTRRACEAVSGLRVWQYARSGMSVSVTIANRWTG